jgi:hypothetical protein
MLRKRSHSRRLHLEALERRELLSVAVKPITKAKAVAPVKTAAVLAPAKAKAVVHRVAVAATPTVPLNADGFGTQPGKIDFAQVAFKIVNGRRTPYINADSHLYRLVAPTTGHMTITDTAAPRSSLDPYLYILDSQQKPLLDSKGNPFVCDDVKNVTLNSRIVSVPVTAGSTYYVKAASFGLTKGAYNLQFATVPKTADVVSDDFAGADSQFPLVDVNSAVWHLVFDLSPATTATGQFRLKIIDRTAKPGDVNTGYDTTADINFNSADLSGTATRIRQALVNIGHATAVVNSVSTTVPWQYRFDVSFPGEPAGKHPAIHYVASAAPLAAVCIVSVEWVFSS